MGKQLKKSLEILKIFGYVTDEECKEIFTKGKAKDDDATEHGSIEEYGKNKEIEKMSPKKHPVQANDAEEQWITVKGAHVKIGEGESKSSAVKKFIKSKGGDPAPAKKAGTTGETKGKFKEHPDSTPEEKERIKIANEFPKGSYIKSPGGKILKITHSDPYENQLFLKVVEGKGKGKEGLFDYKSLKAEGVSKVDKPGSSKENNKTSESSNTSGSSNEEISKIKEKWKGKEYTPGKGSEYGDILNHLEKSSDLPDMEEYYNKRDKLVELRSQGKRNSEEYANAEKDLKQWNKSYNKKHKELEKKAYELSSESEKKRIDEINKAKVKSKDRAIVKDRSIGSTSSDPKEILKYLMKRNNIFSPQEYIAQGKTLKQWENNYGRKYKELEKEANKISNLLKQTQDSDPKVAEANAIINFCGGVL